MLGDAETKQKLQETLSKGNPSTKAVVEAPILVAVCGKRESSGYYKGQVTTKFGDWMLFDLGIATQTDGGLMVPVVRHAEARDLWACASEVARLAEAARSGKAGRDELAGSTITITSLGALGGIVSTPVINHPEVAIVGVNRMAERPMIRGGMVAARKMMNLSSSFDHRVVDGMDGARFVQAVRGYLEAPATLFVE